MEATAKQPSKKNKFGQYFTPKVVAEFMVDLADISANSKVLEPSCGEGVFFDLLQQKGAKNLTAYEIDRELAQEYPYVRHESFVSADVGDAFDLVIGNPPYIRWKNLEEELKQELATSPIWNRYFNSFCDYHSIFILRSIEALKEDGQLIFICPEYWMNTAYSLPLRNYMVQHGCFEEIYHFNETPIFDKVAVSTVVFKYVKSPRKRGHIRVGRFYAKKKLTRDILAGLRNGARIDGVEYLTVPQFRADERWVLQPDDVQEELKELEKRCSKKIGDCCDIGNGWVSGLDKAFRVNDEALNEKEREATIDIVKAKDLQPFFAGERTRYIYLPRGLDETALRETYPHFYNHFQKYKPELENRYQYGRTIHYWEWVFLRNLKLFNQKEKRIFVPCKERISNKDHFRFALVNEQVFPTQDVTAIFKKQTTRESLEYMLAYLNLPIIFDWLKCKGVVKGNMVEFSEKPIASIPFRAIDWTKPEEVELHDTISELTQKYLNSRDKSYLCQVDRSFDKLLKTAQ